jgi:predicted acylesterase/phospholipase RssA
MANEYGDGDFANPTAVCDVIMKGGITSGVVYPRALTALATQFRFSQVGGTSAGAIAAAAAAAAEYGRHVPGGGFVPLAKLPAEVGKILFNLFQPTPALKPVFSMLVAAIGNDSTATKVMRVTVAALAGFAFAAAAGALPGLLIVVAGLWYGSLALVLLGVLLLLIGTIIGVMLCIYRAVSKGIPDNDFGLCPGKTQPGNSTPGLSDWLADKIDEIAGRDPKKDPPLTFGDLSPTEDTGARRHKITLRMMTTNLTLRRPYSLPFTEANEKIYAFKLADFERLFPARITSWLTAHCEKVDDPTGEHADLYKFPEPENLPLIVTTRMSLSFPILFCAVPLYARDFTFASEAERAKWRKNLFSDGGLSNNFPIQFFDRLLPNSPTFGITLDDFSEERVPEDIRKQYPHEDDPQQRVWLPKTTSAGSGVLIPGEPLHGIAAFFSRLLDAAMSWQDNLQSTLPGYRDRIVHVGLKSDEGGLNITMPHKLVDRLAGFGTQAGKDMRDEFDFDEHRWRRFLVAMDRLDHSVDEIAASYNGQVGTESFEAFLNRYPYPPDHPVSYKDAARDHLETLKSRVLDLAELSRRWEAQLQIPDAELPHPKTDLRITPRP